MRWPVMSFRSSWGETVSRGTSLQPCRIAFQLAGKSANGPGSDALRLLWREATRVDQPAPQRRRPKGRDRQRAAPALRQREPWKLGADGLDPGTVPPFAIVDPLAIPRWSIHQVAQQRPVRLVAGKELARERG